MFLRLPLSYQNRKNQKERLIDFFTPKPFDTLNNPVLVLPCLVKNQVNPIKTKNRIILFVD